MVSARPARPHENGKVASERAGGPGSSLTYSYDFENRLSAISGKCGPPTVLSLAYAYNSAQQITNIVERLSDSTNTHAYSYDDRDQLTIETQSSTLPSYQFTNSYTYDFAQNRLSKQNGTQPTDTFSYAIANKMTNIHIGASSANNRYWCDLAGNLTSNMQNGTITRHYYNAQNKLVRIEGSASRTSSCTTRCSGG